MAVIEAIATTYLEADAASVTFSSLGSYEHLRLQITSRGVTTSYHSPDVYLRFNSDSGTNYSNTFIYADSLSATAAQESGQTAIKCGQSSGSYGTSQATQYGGLIVDIFDYANANKNTTVCINSGVLNDEQSAFQFRASLWDDTSAVTQIDLLPAHDDWTRGCEFTLFGLASS